MKKGWLLADSVHRTSHTCESKNLQTGAPCLCAGSRMRLQPPLPTIVRMVYIYCRYLYIRAIYCYAAIRWTGRPARNCPALEEIQILRFVGNRTTEAFAYPM